MKTIVWSLILMLLLTISNAYASGIYGRDLCHEDDSFYCLEVGRGQSWDSLFPDDRERELVRRLNRINIGLHRGQIIAVPRDLSNTSLMDVSPFPHQINGSGSKLVIVDLSEQAFGAYDSSGDLVHWGPISGGKGYCPDVNRRCRSPVGAFAFYTSRGPDCYSFKFPIGKGGAPMPYCMFFFRGFAMHGSPELPGYHASHGCIRMFYDDARWLNEDFVDLPGRAGARRGTRVIVRP